MSYFASQRPALLDGLDDALRDPHPLALLGLVSTLAQASAPARFAGTSFAPQGSSVDRKTLIDSFLDVDMRETDALLRVWAEMLDDDALRTQLSRRGRRHSLPQWLSQLDRIRPTRAVIHTHILGDGDNVYLGVETPGRSFTLAFYIDHNMGTIVKDCFAADVPIGEVIRRSEELHDEGSEHHEILLEDARAKLQQGIENGDRLLEPIQNDTWPAAKPLAEWMVRLLPEHGEGYSWREPTNKEWKALERDFAASPFAEGMDSEDLDRARTLFGFATHYGSGDPLRWSSVVVEIVLLDMIPRKVIAERDYLHGMPDAVRAVVRFAHDRRGIPAQYTAMALAAVDEYEDEYREMIAKPRRHGAEALLERMGVLPLLDELDDEHVLTDEEYYLGRIARQVGGMEVLSALDVEPLPDEDLDLLGISDDVIDRVEEVRAIADGVFTEFFEDLELRTVGRRLLARIATADARIFRRAGRTDTGAAALCWIAAKLNDELEWGVLGEMMQHLGLKGSPTQRAQPMLAALGADAFDWAYDPLLGDAALLTAKARANIVRQRDRWREHGSDVAG